VNELKDFLLQYPIVLENHLSKVCDKLVELMLDSSGDVRMALYSLLDEVLPILPETLVSPFFPLFVAYLSTGMTHVNAAVRLDALQYSNLWLYYHPNLVSKLHFKFLPHYLTLMATREPPPKMEKPEKIRRLQKKEKKAPHEAKLHIPNALKSKNVLLASLYDLAVATLGHAEHYGTNDNIDLESSKFARKHLHLGDVDQDVSNGAFPRVSPVVVPFQASYTLENIVEANSHLSSLGTSKIESTAKQNVSATPTEAMLHLEEPECFKYFFTTVYPLLISQWLECDPENLVPHALKPLESILKIFDLLLSHLDSLIGSDAESQSAKVEFLDKYLSPMSKYVFSVFPFDYPPNWTDDELSIVTHLNVLIAMLGSHFYNKETSSSPWATSMVDYTLRAFSGTITRPVGRRGKQNNEDEEFVKRRPDPHLQSYEDDAAESSSNAMQGQSDKKSKKDKTSQQDSMHFQIVGELLPVIRRLTSLSSSSDDEEEASSSIMARNQLQQRKRLLKAFQTFNEACPPKSHSKRMCIAFISTLLLEDESATNGEQQERASTSMNVDQASLQTEKKDSQADSDLELAPRELITSIPSDISNALLLSLPKTLWQLQGDFPVTSQTILGILAHLGANPLRKAQLDLLQPAFVPFFWTSIAKKPKAKKASSSTKATEESEEPKRKAIFGPFIKLPDHVQRTAIDVIANMTQLTPAMVESLLHSFSHPKVGVETIGYMFETIQGHFDSVGDFVSFVLSFLIAVTSETLDNDNETGKYRMQRCFVISRILARASSQLLLKDVFLQLIEDHLASLLGSFLEDATSSTSDEFFLSSSLCSFIGSYIKLSGLSSVPAAGSSSSSSSTPQNPLPESLRELIPKAMLHIIKLSSTNSQKAPATTSFHPHLIMIKDLIQAVPETLGAIVDLLSKEIVGGEVSQNKAEADAAPTVVLDLISKYRTPAQTEVLKNSNSLTAILNYWKEHRSEDPIVRRACTEMELLNNH
jgi:hypothetical protein